MKLTRYFKKVKTLSSDLWSSHILLLCFLVSHHYSCHCKGNFSMSDKAYTVCSRPKAEAERKKADAEAEAKPSAERSRKKCREKEKERERERERDASNDSLTARARATAAVVLHVDNLHKYSNGCRTRRASSASIAAHRSNMREQLHKTRERDNTSYT